MLVFYVSVDHDKCILYDVMFIRVIFGYIETFY